MKAKTIYTDEHGPVVSMDDFDILQCSHDELLSALEAAKDHLEYLGYGDNWEKECAEEKNLPELIEEAIKKARGL